jgi:capsular polysaccharide transport system permease protein
VPAFSAKPSGLGDEIGGRGRNGIQRLSGWQIQWRVVDALVYRELRTRLSEVRGGFFGVLLQPLGLVAIWVAFLAALNLHRGGSMNIVLFLTSGIIVFGIFAHIANRSARGMMANQALLFYRPVKPIDTVIARTVCETALNVSCYFVILTGTWIFLDQIVLADLGLFFISILLASLLGFSVGLIFMTVGFLVPGFVQISTWIPRILWFLSGVPFRYWTLPAWCHPFFKWNPLMHCIELNRRSLSDDYFTPDASLGYALTSALVLATIALWVYSNNERRLLTL